MHTVYSHWGTEGAQSDESQGMIFVFSSWPCRSWSCAPWTPIICIKTVWIINQGKLLELQILHIFKTPKKFPLGDSHTISEKPHSCLPDLNEKYLICARWNVWSASDEDEVQERTGDTGDGCRRGGRLSPPHTYLLCYSACSVQCHNKPNKSTFYRHTNLRVP